jgi:hypothetical protein
MNTQTEEISLTTGLRSAWYHKRDQVPGYPIELWPCGRKGQSSGRGQATCHRIVLFLSRKRIILEVSIRYQLDKQEPLIRGSCLTLFITSCCLLSRSTFTLPGDRGATKGVGIS